LYPKTRKAEEQLSSHEYSLEFSDEENTSELYVSKENMFKLIKTYDNIQQNDDKIDSIHINNEKIENSNFTDYNKDNTNDKINKPFPTNDVYNTIDDIVSDVGELDLVRNCNEDLDSHGDTTLNKTSEHINNKMDDDSGVSTTSTTNNERDVGDVAEVDDIFGTTHKVIDSLQRTRKENHENFPSKKKEILPIENDIFDDLEKNNTTVRIAEAINTNKGTNKTIDTLDQTYDDTTKEIIEDLHETLHRIETMIGASLKSNDVPNENIISNTSSHSDNINEEVNISENKRQQIVFDSVDSKPGVKKSNSRLKVNTLQNENEELNSLNKNKAVSSLIRTFSGKS